MQSRGPILRDRALASFAVVDFLRVRLDAARDRLPGLRDFYAGRLGLEPRGRDRFAIGVGELAFEAAGGDPFYHFALLVPGDRFEDALAWARERVELLPGGDSDEVRFDFDEWGAVACYFHDPAGNIVELVAHRRVGESGASGRFDASELLGFSEVGLVGKPQEMARGLEQLRLSLWDGTLEEPGRLAFLGERAKTLILAPEGRGWLPTGRPAATHPVDLVVTGPPSGEVTIGAHRVRRS
jgi:catechol 2,3-dioxygenase-like lactoylglutathione lyase family enzyme